MILVAFLAACGSTSQATGGQRPAVSSGGLPSQVCPFATKDDASRALGQPSGDGFLDGPGTCTFIPAGSATTPSPSPSVAPTAARTPTPAGASDRATISLSIVVQTETSTSIARQDYGLFAQGDSVTGIGDQATYTKTGNQAMLVVLSGSKIIRLVLRRSKVADPKSALSDLAKTVLGRS